MTIPSDLDRDDVDELLDIAADLMADLSEARAEVRRLRERVQELESRQQPTTTEECTNGN